MSLLRGASFRVFPQRCALVVAGLLLDVANHRREVFLGDGKGAVGPLPLYGFIGSEHMGHQMTAAVAGCAAACKGLSIDGKYTRTPFWDDHYAQQQSGQNGQEPYGMVRTLTCSLVTEATEPCLDAVPQLDKTLENIMARLGEILLVPDMEMIKVYRTMISFLR